MPILSGHLPILDALPDPAFIIEAESGCVLVVNRRLCERFGIKPAAWEGLPLFDLLGHDKNELRRIVPALDESGPAVSVPALIARGSRTFEGTLTLSRFIDAGRPYGLCSLREVSNQGPDSQGSLYGKLRDLFDHSNEVIFTLDPSGHMTSVNPAGSTLFGYETSEIIGQPVRRFVAPDAFDRAVETYRKVFDEGEPTPSFELHCSRKSGEELWIEVSILKLVEDGRVLGSLGLGRDITERKRAEEALLESQERLREQKTILSRVIDQNPYAIALWTPEGELCQCNNAFVRMIGTVPGAGFNLLDDSQAIEAGIRESFDRARHGETIFLERARYIVGRDQGTSSNSKPVRFSLILFPVVDAEGRTIHIVTLFQDMAHEIEEKAAREMLEAQLRHAQKMEAIGTLAGGLAHDFNNLLTGVIGYLDIIRASCPEDVHAYVNKAEKAALRACDLTRQLLAYARKTRIETIAHDLNHTAAEVSALVEKTIDPRIGMQIVTMKDPATVMADPGQMNQVLMNLLINARDAVKERLDVGRTPRGWQPLIRVRNRKVFVSSGHRRQDPASREGWFICLAVSDTGIGMDQSTRSRIFDPFFTTKPVGSGTGLGLATLFGIVTQHQGWIEVLSRPGKGSVFKVYLPVVDAEPEVPSDLAVSVKVKGGTETILLVDDEETIRELGKDILEEKGYRVLLAENGEEGVEVFRERHADIDLVLLDMAMPRLSGAEVMPLLKEIVPEVRIVASSGYTSREETRAAISRGASAFVEKPYHTSDLLRAVRHVLDGDEATVLSAPSPDSGREYRPWKPS